MAIDSVYISGILEFLQYYISKFPILIQMSLERLMKETVLVCLYYVAMAMLSVTDYLRNKNLL